MSAALLPDAERETSRSRSSEEEGEFLGRRREEGVASEGKRPRDDGNSDQDEGGGCHGSPVRRGVRASFFRSKATPRPKSLCLNDADAAAHPSPCPSRTTSSGEREPLELLLSASEEGDYQTVLEVLKRPDASVLVNLHGFARNIVAEFDAETGRPVEWGHPESLTCYRGDTALRYAAFHGYAAIVRALLAAGAVPGLRNDDAKGALMLAELGADLLKKKHAKRLAPVDLPRGDPLERAEVLTMLKEATSQQWVIVDCKPEMDGRIAQVVACGADGLRLAIVNDAAPSEARPYYEKSAATSVFLVQSQLRRLPPPPPPAKSWPLDTRFTGLDSPVLRVNESPHSPLAPSTPTRVGSSSPAAERGCLRARDECEPASPRPLAQPEA